MASQILATKLYRPAIRQSRIVRRSRLTERMDVGFEGKLTLLSAPAGFGKTTLVAEWLVATGHPAGWLSLDASDNDPARFLTYVVAALQTIAPQVGQDVMSLLQAPQPPTIDALLTPLLNAMATIPYEFVLVLDDYHVLDNQAIDAALAFLIDRAPPTLHLIITTREDPPLPLARLRARSDLVELRVAELRFTPTEAAEFLNHGMGLHLSAAEVEVLEARTEGWIAGLQMAAISLTGHNNTADFLQSFTGSHRFILDYLVEEILQQQSEQVRHFLFQTSGLPRLSASLCNAVTGQEDGQELLTALERGNMLIVPLDDQRQWYRYHQLFAEVLQSYARTVHPDQVPVWQQRASAWYEQHGFRAEAIHAAFAAGNVERAADLIEQSWPVIFNGFQPATWLQWVQLLPDALVQARPVLSAGYAWILLDNGELAAAARQLARVEAWLDTVTAGGQVEAARTGMVIANVAQFALLPATTASAQAYHALALGDAASAISYAQRALALLPENEHYWHGTTALFLGLAQWARGNLEPAYQSLNASIASQRQAGNQYFQVFGTVMLADIRVAQGRLHAALRHYEQALHLAAAGARVADAGTDPAPLAGPVALYAGFSELYRIRGELDTARTYIEIGQAVLERSILPGSAYRLFCASARIAAAQGDVPAAFAQLQAAERRYQATAVPDVQPIAALEARVRLQQGQVARAQAWAQQRGLSLQDELSYEREFEHITLARILIAAGRQQQSESGIYAVLQLLERLLHAAEAGGRQGSMIEICLLQAIAHQAHADEAAALACLERALHLAEPEGAIQVFLDEGPAIQAMLARSLARSSHPAYAQRLLNRIRRKLADDNHAVETNQLLVEPLSKRELEILQLLASGYANQAIADELVIALSTVKKHVNNIFGKLNVDSRTQAIQRARDLHILR